MSLAELDEMAYDDYLRWRAFYNWEHWRKETAESAARLHAKGLQGGSR